MADPRYVIDHAGLEVRDFETSRAFYEAALEPLGFSLQIDFADRFKAIGLGIPGKPSFWIRESGEVSAPLHIAFHATDRDRVDRFHEAALAAGGRDNGPPGLREHYHPTYYGAFVLDPDGNNVEAVCHTPPNAGEPNA
jgi:catechol 2,3-dioxygenase-like lactoylglutathione lyase family enzyme